MADEYMAIEVNFKLAGMALPSMPMHLDDLIAAGAVKEFVAQSGGNAVVDDYDSIIHRLPLEKHSSEGGDWVYKASRIRFIQVTAPFMRSISQRVDKREFALLRSGGVLNTRQNTLNEVSGTFKSSIDLIPSAAYVEAVGYCVGDLGRVRQILSYITNVGKKHNRGQGQVLDLKVTRLEGSMSDTFWADRFLPLSMQSIASERHVLTTNVATKPPYWKNKGVGLVIT